MPILWANREADVPDDVLPVHPGHVAADQLPTDADHSFADNVLIVPKRWLNPPAPRPVRVRPPTSTILPQDATHLVLRLDKHLPCICPVVIVFEVLWFLYQFLNHMALNVDNTTIPRRRQLLARVYRRLTRTANLSRYGTAATRMVNDMIDDVCQYVAQARKKSHVHGKRHIVRLARQRKRAKRAKDVHRKVRDMLLRRRKDPSNDAHIHVFPLVQQVQGNDAGMMQHTQKLDQTTEEIQATDRQIGSCYWALCMFSDQLIKPEVQRQCQLSHTRSSNI
jgi:hypothetical protein